MPPRTSGQPKRCASVARTMPNAEVSGADSATIEWAAMPVNSARAGASRKTSRGEHRRGRERRESEPCQQRAGGAGLGAAGRGRGRRGGPTPAPAVPAARPTPVRRDPAPSTVASSESVEEHGAIRPEQMRKGHGLDAPTPPRGAPRSTDRKNGDAGGRAGRPCCTGRGRKPGQRELARSGCRRRRVRRLDRRAPTGPPGRARSPPRARSARSRRRPRRGPVSVGRPVTPASVRWPSPATQRPGAAASRTVMPHRGRVTDVAGRDATGDGCRRTRARSSTTGLGDAQRWREVLNVRSQNRSFWRFAPSR